jgi:membrane-associated phospholipid phosphatase
MAHFSLRSAALYVGLAVFSFAVATITVPCQAQTPTSLSQEAPSENRWVPSLRTLGGDGVHIATAPLRLSRDDAPYVAGAAGLTLTLIASLDEPTYRRIAQSDGSASGTATALGTLGNAYDSFGTTKVAGLTVGALALSGTALRDRTMTRASVRVLEAVFFSELVTGGIKTLTGRLRPFTGANADATDPLVLDGDHNALSFPSGHTSQAFAIATVLAQTYDTWYVQVPVYSVATSQAVQRIESGKHWLSDVVVGAALGVFIGRALTRTHEDPGAVEASGIHYRPVLSTGRAGLSVRF